MHTEAQVSGGMDGDEVLAQLAKRFANFRASHARLTRVPENLRGAVLDAADRGVSGHAIRRACGVSISQIASWQDSRARCSASPAQAPAHRDGVRVFPVEEAQSAQPQAEETLTLQLGAWSVSIRLASATLATRS